jgi:capsule polysaccharide modification protein KpsS
LKKKIPFRFSKREKINIQNNPYLQESKKLSEQIFLNPSLVNITRQIKNWKFHALKPARKKLFLNSCHPIPNTPFLLFPLQVTPESSLVSQCPEFCNQEEVIRRLAQSAPLNCKIVVREHPNMIGRRPLQFFRKILSLGNVILNSPHVPLQNVLQRASYICSCTSTVALEALLEGHSVSLLGRPWFSVHQRAFLINKPEDAFFHKTNGRRKNGLSTSSMVRHILNSVHLSNDSAKFSESFKKCIHGHDVAETIKDLIFKITKYNLNPKNTRRFWWENYLAENRS